ncbi:MAG TPA: TGS domain-containing protein [bacterium]|nr:TGS domain-containing protein [bacterium]
MPANLPPNYYAAEQRYREARSIPEKIDILREMMAIMPKHKGTEHLQGDLKRKIAKLQGQAQKKQIKSRTSSLDYIPREGAGQAVLVGAPNSGKSTFVGTMTNAHTEVAEYPFSTFKPVQGMMPFEDIQIQLVDMPPISMEYSESWMYNIIRLADLVLFLVAVDEEKPDETAFNVLSLLEERHIELGKNGDKKPQGQRAFKSCRVIATKAGNARAEEGIVRLRTIFEDEMDIIEWEATDSATHETLKKKIFDDLKIIRIYTKIPGYKADYEKPYVLAYGSTVMDAAREIHKEVAESMRYARIWNDDRLNGRRVERDYVLNDRDVLEIHTR